MVTVAPELSLRRSCSVHGLGLLAAIFLLTCGANAQVTTWTSFFLIDGGFYIEPGIQRTAVAAGYAAYATSWPILGTASPGTTPTPPTWVGALTSTPANLGALYASGTDAAGDTYGLYGTTLNPGPYPAYVSKTTPNNVTVYFGLNSIGGYGGMAVTPSGDLYVSSGGTVFRLNPDGTTTVAAQVLVDAPVPFLFSADANDDITIPNIDFFFGAIELSLKNG
jgi:hypothetical protein